MRFALITSILTCLPFWAFAQIEQVTVGPGYSQSVYYSLKDGSAQGHALSTWDIAFEVFGQTSAGIFVNEGVANSNAAPLPQVSLYLSDTSDFYAAIDTSMIGARLHNQELSWAEGAFNAAKDPQNPFDYGWGEYDVTTHQVVGNRVFILQLRDSSYKKIQINALAGGAFQFTYANLDGTGDTTQTLIRADFSGKTLAYFSFESETFLDLEPEAWDLLFTRYTTPLDDGQGNILQYMVSGVLSGRDVQVAQADSVDPNTVDPADYQEAYTEELTAIGHDWKSFDLNLFQWSVPEDRVYFIKTREDSLWKVQFIDFEGASTGTSTLEKTPLGVLTHLSQDELKIKFAFNAYPNPAQGDFWVAYELPGTVKVARLELLDLQGRKVWERPLARQMGFHAQDIQTQLPAGMYMLRLQLGQHMLADKLLIQ